MKSNREKIGLAGAIITAIFGSLCCVAPLILVGLGISGAWISKLSAFEAYQPYFIIATVIFLSIAFYSKNLSQKVECEPGSHCENPKNKKMSNLILWFATAFIILLFATPYIVPIVFKSEAKAAKTDSHVIVARELELNVSNMTCASCEVTVTKSLTNVDGVISAKVTLVPPKAKVVYDPEKVSIEDLIKATTNAGYPSSI